MQDPDITSFSEGEFEEFLNERTNPRRREKLEEKLFDRNEDRSILREYGRPRSYSNINHVQVYTNTWPDVALMDPSVLTIANRGNIPYTPIYEYLNETGWVLAWQNSTYTTKEMERPGMVLFAHKEKPGFMLELCLTYTTGGRKRKKSLKKIDNFKIPGTIGYHEKYRMTEGDQISIEDATLYTQCQSSPYWDEAFVKTMIGKFEDLELPEKTEDAEISIIVINNGDYDIRSFSLADANTTFNFPDLHYGEGFESFHSSLLKRIDDESKGLILFHGQPGTGKTQYIRHLLKELCNANKAVLYSPPAVSASLAEPQMINFISDWIMGEKRDCILLIEDAEPLLESRSGGVDGRSTGISNLLNITDGILNDILGLMVIATFNIEINKIDPALLRPGRLLARKEFKKMDELQTENLASTLGMEKPDIDLDKYPITLAEFYNNRKAKSVLIHDYKKDEKNRIGFRSH
jgi:hypothetical protein